MGTMNCLACGHDNKTGEASCTACSAALDLKLCGTCEAINAPDAERCHGCGASFGLGSASFLPAERSLPSAWLISGEPRPRSRALTAALWLVPVLAVAGFTSYHYVAGVAQARQAVAFTPPVAVMPEPQITEFKLAPELAVIAVTEEPVKNIRVEAPITPARTTFSRIKPRVTHTRGPDADTAAAGGATAAPKVESAACAGQAKVLDLCAEIR
jgi:ribosomal protein L40E